MNLHEVKDPEPQPLMDFMRAKYPQYLPWTWHEDHADYTDQPDHITHMAAYDCNPDSYWGKVAKRWEADGRPAQMHNY